VFASLALWAVAGASRDRITHASFWFDAVKYSSPVLGGPLTANDLATIETVARAELAAAFQGLRIAISDRRDTRYHVRVVQEVLDSPLKRKTWVAGSSHAGEEELLLSAYGQIVKTHPSTVLMLAPRHIERVDRVETMIRGAGFIAQRKSQIREVAAGPRVIILDTRGELAHAYREAVATFVGGTLVPVGGHNLLEPAVWGKPVMFGPYTDHCAEVATLLQEAGGGCRVSGVGDLVHYLNGWLSNQEACERVGQAARRVVLENQGALKRSLEFIESCLTSAPSGSKRFVETAPGPVMARP